MVTYTCPELGQTPDDCVDPGRNSKKRYSMAAPSLQPSEIVNATPETLPWVGSGSGIGGGVAPRLPVFASVPESVAHNTASLPSSAVSILHPEDAFLHWPSARSLATSFDGPLPKPDPSSPTATAPQLVNGPNTSQAPTYTFGGGRYARHAASAAFLAALALSPLPNHHLCDASGLAIARWSEVMGMIPSTSLLIPFPPPHPDNPRRRVPPQTNAESIFFNVLRLICCISSLLPQETDFKVKPRGPR